MSFICPFDSLRSPVYVDESADIELAAKRIMWGKVYNCGQSPLAPDYALCHSDVQVRFDWLIMNRSQEFEIKSLRYFIFSRGSCENAKRHW